MSTSHQERGFGLIIVIVLIAAVIGVGVLAYATRAKLTASTSPTATPTPSAGVLKFAKLGFQVTLPAGLSVGDVTIRETPANEAAQDVNGQTYHYLGSVELSTAALTKAAANCGVTAGPIGAAGVIAYEVYQENPRSYAIASGPTNVTLVGDHYVAIRDRQSACSMTADHPTMDPLEDAVYQQFVTAFASAKRL